MMIAYITHRNVMRNYAITKLQRWRIHDNKRTSVLQHVKHVKGHTHSYKKKIILNLYISSFHSYNKLWNLLPAQFLL